MALKSPVPKEGSSYEVIFKASSHSGGSTIVTVGWVSKGGSPVPPVRDMSIAAGTLDSIDGIVPSINVARRMEIRVALPNGTGSGTLTLRIDGEDHAEEALSTDTTWTSLVG